MTSPLFAEILAHSKNIVFKL